MKAVTYDRYTTPDGLRLSDVPAPQPAAGQVLVRVAAASLNAYDWHMYRGEPLIMRLQSGRRVREPRIVGADFSGTVEALGEGVDGLAVGDRVLGEGPGSCAELVATDAGAVAPIAKSVGFEAAAAAPMAGLTALQALRDTAGLQKGGRVLVWGASGGVGHLAVQIARALGADHVDAVCSGGNAAMVAAQGADHVYDYTAGGVPAGEAYDVILDTVSTQPMRRIRRLLAPGGRWVMVGGLGGGRVLGPLTTMIRRRAAAAFLRVDARGMLAKVNADDLAAIAGWLGDGSLTPVVQRSYPLQETPEACAELERGHVAGKLVISQTSAGSTSRSKRA